LRQAWLLYKRLGPEIWTQSVSNLRQESIISARPQIRRQDMREAERHGNQNTEKQPILSLEPYIIHSYSRIHEIPTPCPLKIQCVCIIVIMRSNKLSLRVSLGLSGPAADRTWSRSSDAYSRTLDICSALTCLHLTHLICVWWFDYLGIVQSIRCLTLLEYVHNRLLLLLFHLKYR
jgi:hypothetical protein